MTYNISREMIAKIYSDIKSDFKYIQEFNKCIFFDKNLDEQNEQKKWIRLDYKFILL